MITVVGLGDGAGQISVNGLKAVESANKLFVKTAKTAAGAALGKYAPEYLDELFDAAEDFDALTDAIAKRVSACGDAVYCVDGDGYSDASVIRLSELTEVTVIAGALGSLRPADAVTVLNASSIAAKPYIDNTVALCVREIDSGLAAGDVKLYLWEYYPYDTVAWLYGADGTKEIMLEDLDRQKKYDSSTALYIPPLDAVRKDTYTFGDLKRIIEKLTAPDGCPWDKVQTHESIRVNLIEEAYEAVDAIDGGDPDDMAEEFGDVLLQSVLHCDIARRYGEFTLGEVLTGLCAKLVHRHTHVFGGDKAGDDKEALKFWEAAKAAEKNTDGYSDELKRLPESFPSLLRGQKTVKKAAKYGKQTLDGFIERGKRADATLGERLLGLCAEAQKEGLDAEVELNLILNKLRDKA